MKIYWKNQDAVDAAYAILNISAEIVHFEHRLILLIVYYERKKPKVCSTSVCFKDLYNCFVVLQ